MASTARPQRLAAKRTMTNSSAMSSSTATPSHSPFDSPTQSASSTSLSSMGSVDDCEPPKSTKSQTPLLDTYGNTFEVPDFTIKEIRDAIPAHCFERSAATGLYYVARDMALLGTTFYLFHTYLTPQNVPSLALRSGLWALYTFVQGLFGTGLWVLAHECGHQSFSPSKVLNDTVGFICHSLLLVPYFSWKISHGKHHKATGHLERDMVFVPYTRDTYAKKFGRLAHDLHEMCEETPIYTAGHMIGQQLAGWIIYLLSNTTGHNYHERQVEGKGKGKRNGWFTGVNHFQPSSPLYERKDEHLILLSDAGLATVAGLLITIGKLYGWSNLFVWYILPYLWVNHWLVAITYLQHTDPTLPHYSSTTWTFARGAAATIDRNFWPIGPYLFHGIIETHVLHHFISQIPFYHADEATEAIKPVMGQHYRSNTEGGMFGFLKSMWTSARWCNWVESNTGLGDGEGAGKGVYLYRNRNGLGVPPMPVSGKEE